MAHTYLLSLQETFYLLRIRDLVPCDRKSRLLLKIDFILGPAMGGWRQQVE